MNTPAPGTVCSVCHCCPADFACGDGTPLCWPCDAGEHNSVATQPEPAAAQAAAPEPASPEKTMEKRLCACGCNTEMSENNNWLYWRGHKPKHLKGAKKQKLERKQKPAPPVVEPDAAQENASPVVALELDEQQLGRIWDSLPIEEKALAIATALTADRS